jgi:hypothetical protein
MLVVGVPAAAAALQLTHPASGPMAMGAPEDFGQAGAIAGMTYAASLPTDFGPLPALNVPDSPELAKDVEGSLAAHDDAPVGANSASQASRGKQLGSAGGPRAGQKMTPKAKRTVRQDNRAKDPGKHGAGKCNLCGKDLKPSKQSESGVPTDPAMSNVDHIVPASKGGDGDASNGQDICAECNNDKSDNIDGNPSVK